jgi:hypothetical protein
MRKGALFVPLAAALAALALTTAYLPAALEAAGPYKQLPEVKVGTAVGMFPSYFLVFWGAAVAASRVWRARSLVAVSAWLACWAVVAHFAIVFVPVLPFVLLALVCRVQVLCPDAADPIAWSYLGLVSPGKVPFAPLWVVLILGAVAGLVHVRSVRSSEA